MPRLGAMMRRRIFLAALSVLATLSVGGPVARSSADHGGFHCLEDIDPGHRGAYDCVKEAQIAAGDAKEKPNCNGIAFTTRLESTGTRVTWYPHVFCNGYIPPGRTVEAHLNWQIVISHSVHGEVFRETVRDRSCWMSAAEPYCSTGSRGFDCDTTPGTVTVAESVAWADSDYGDSPVVEEQAWCN